MCLGVALLPLAAAEPVCRAPKQQEELLRKRVLADLSTIESIFEVKYAPLRWKGEWMGWSLEESFRNARNRISSLKNPSLKACQHILRELFTSTADYHVGIHFYSTEEAFLPFGVAEAEGRYFFAEVPQWGGLPFAKGDEIIAFDGVPVATVVAQLREEYFGHNTPETDQALATRMLTYRSGELGHRVPEGIVAVTWIKKGEKREQVSSLFWDYESEQIRDFSTLGDPYCCQRFTPSPRERAAVSLQKEMRFSQWTPRQHAAYALGERTGSLPPLGAKLWSSSPDALFDAYIFLCPGTKTKVGYIRIPHYMCGVEHVQEFGRVMNKFQKETEMLVIDQLDNPGGSVFYLYALASTLAKTPLKTPKHHIALTQEEVHTAVSQLPYLDQVIDDESARRVLGSEMGGYPIDYLFASLTKEFFEFLITQWNQGKLYSDPIHIFGVDKIQPHPDYRYTKPILLLINSLDFSGGDFFPAILQDNGRAVLMGARTAGAGGYVYDTSFPNHSGIRDFLLTGSLAERDNKAPIENLGVHPDITYKCTVEDLTKEYQPYRKAILEVVEKVVKGKL